MSMMISSGTSSPLSLYSFIFFPSSVSCLISLRTRSPVSICVAPVSSSSFAAWVPLPAPWGPIIMILITPPSSSLSSQEPFVVAHHQLALELAHHVQRDADHDQYRRATERDPGSQIHDARNE